MLNRMIAAIIAVSLLSPVVVPTAALADNSMGYQLLTADQASSLQKNGGKLGMQVGRAEQITSGGLTFDILRVKGVASNSAAAQAGFKIGDQIIAVDGKVFPSVATFAAYVGSHQPADRISVDYMPPDGGPKDAQRTTVTLGGGGGPAHAPAQPEPTGLSTGTKIAIGAGAAVLFGCYKFGCFSHRAKPGLQSQPSQQ